MWSLLRFIGFGFALILLITCGWLSLTRVPEPESLWILLRQYPQYDQPDYDPYLVRVNTNGTGTKQLTTEGEFYFLHRAHWSYKGDSIILTGSEPFSYEMSVYRLNSNGSESEVISPPNSESVSDAYQVDNGDIFISEWTENSIDYTLYRFEPTTGEIRIIIDSDKPIKGIGPLIEKIRPSPDGNWVLFANNAVGYRVKSDGTQLVRLPQCLYDVPIYSWSPDSQYLPCIDEGNLSLINVETLESNLIKKFDDQIYNLSWSPDGEWLLFIIEHYPQPSEVYKMRKDGTDLTRLTYTDQYERVPSWSPDGNWIAFFRSRGYSNYSLYKMRPDGTDELWLGDFNYIQPLWSPIIDYAWHDKHLFGVGGMLLLLSLLPIKKSLSHIQDCL